MNERHYYCTKKREEDEILYIFFCPERIPSDKGWVELIPCIQKTIIDMENSYITGIEGFFILESSVDAEAEKILRLYKERDKAEKFIRNLKEGIELHPVRHWNKWCIIGIFFICFLANYTMAV